MSRNGADGLPSDGAQEFPGDLGTAEGAAIQHKGVYVSIPAAQPPQHVVVVAVVDIDGVGITGARELGIARASSRKGGKKKTG